MGSTTILSGRWTIYDLDENRRRAMIYTGAGTRDHVKDIYLALADVEHGGTWMDDGEGMQADTPTEFKIGRFSAGDLDPMFIDPESVQYMYGGSLKTILWKRDIPGDGTGNVGIVRFDYMKGVGTNLVAGDIGKTIVSDGGDSGTLLFFITDGSNGTVWVRPDSNALADDWNSTATDFDVTGGTGINLNQNLPATTGEMNWANIYNDVGGVATLEPDTHLAIYQDEQSGDTAPDVIVLEYDVAQSPMRDYYDDGTFDIMLLIADQAADLATQSGYIDEGFATILARQYQKTFTYNIASLFPGGRVPIGMETADDSLNNPSGYGSVTLGTSAGNWNVGDEIEGQAGAAETHPRAIITAVSGSNPTITLEFYYIGKNIDHATVGYEVFDGSEAINNNDDTGTSASSGAVSNVGPAALIGLSITHAANGTFDVDQSGSNELYSIVFNVNSEALDDAFEWARWKFRRGERTTAEGDGQENEQYLGSDYRVTYTGAVTGAMNEGEVMTGGTSGAKGTIVAHHTSDKVIILRNSRGAFQNTEVMSTPTGSIPNTGVVSMSVAPVKSCPIGTLAGGIFFLAPGVVVNNRIGDDANNYRCVDDLGNTNIKEPVQISITIGNTRIKDWIALYRMTGSGGTVEKDTYAVDAGGLLKGGNSVVITGSIGVDEPGKSAGGILVVKDTTTFAEHVYHFSSWTGSTFTLDQTVSGTATGGDTNTLIDSGGGLSALRVGELIRNTTDDEWAYVTEVTSDTQVETTVVTGWSGDGYVANDLVQNYDSADDVYVILIYAYETAGTDGAPGNESVTIVYNAPFYTLLKARAANDSAYKIKPFALELDITNADKSQSVIRTPETITS